MAKQTINIGASPNDGTGTPLRTAFDYTNQNFTELYTATGPSGNNIVVPGSATITGDLTVSAGTVNGVAYLNGSKVLTAGSTLLFDGTNLGIAGAGQFRFATSGGAIGDNTIGTENSFSMMLRCGRGSTSNIELASDKLVFSTSASERYRIASDGVATWSNVGGVAGTAMRLNSTGLGVGVSPAYTLHAKKVLSGTSTTVNGLLYLENTGAGNSAKITLTDGVSNNGYIVYSFETGTPTLGLGVGSAQQLVVNASGNVGIGVTPSAWSGITALQISRGSFASDTGSYTLNQNVFNNGSNRYIATAAAMQFQAIPGTGFLWNIAPSGTAGNAITFTQAMTLDASGNLLVGTTASGGQNGFCVLRPLSAAVVATTTETAHNFGALTGTTYATFLYATTAIGSITQNGTTGVLYNINSDYRLKESVAPLSGGLARVNALKPSIYKWKSDGSSGEGFLAHELAEVVPAAVTGEKDAVNEDGSIKSQGIDMSRVVPILVAAIQELTARVQTLETR